MPVVPPMAEVKLLRSMQEEIVSLTREAENGADAKAIAEVAGLQGDLARQGEALLKKMSERRQQRPNRPEGEQEGAEPKKEPEQPGEQPGKEDDAG